MLRCSTKWMFKCIFTDSINRKLAKDEDLEKGIIILDAEKDSSQKLFQILSSRQYQVEKIQAFSSLEVLIASDRYLAVVVDIDTVPIDNLLIRDLTLKYPSMRFLCTSKDRFHPELKDAICYHIYACLNKPIDPDELLYWIKSIYEEEKIPDT
ncbi:MAG: hypothetical protein JSW26_03605 [Desulfobacterales bacterium]|nr:MAG: hypothetical protein JSW26_03605 [Desulfobacterales bacterium]